MKKVKRFLAIILCMCALAGMMATNASAVTTLTIINLTVDAPVVGQKASSTTASVPSHARSTVEKVEWTGEFDDTNTFLEGVSYKLTVTMGIKKGSDCRFSSKSINAKVNGKAADEVLWYSDSKVQVIYTFPSASSKASAKTIDTIYLTIDAPAFGKQPATTAKLSAGSNGTVNSTVESLKWSGNLASDGTFKAGTKYTVTVTMGIKSGSNYIFSDKSISATVNGKKADEVLWYADDHVEVIYTFPATSTSSTISKANITLEAPVAGQNPATTAGIPAGVDYTVKKVEWAGALSNGKFMENTEYTVMITLGIKSGANAAFSDKSFDAYINGSLMDQVIWNSGTEIVVWGTFDKTAAGSGTTTPAAGSFLDVAADAYYAQPVRWAVDNSITNGIGDNLFGPEQTCNQAQILTFLWRATGSPEPKGLVKLEGFDGTEYYYKAAAWAAERNMVGGEFLPEAPCTRAMAVSFMWNYAGSPYANPASFTDVASNADYAGAVAWAVANGVTDGTGDNQFSPALTCTRGQIATFLYRAFAT